MQEFFRRLELAKWVAYSASFALIFGFLNSATAQDETSSGQTYFANVNVFDGSKLVESTNVLVAEGKIAAVGSDVAAPKDAKTIDGQGKTLLPGLIDTHVHAFFESQLKQAALFGVTTELDMMAFPQAVANWRAQQKDGDADNRADILSAGAAVTVKDGHGTQFGFAVPTLDSAENASTFVNERVREGSDYIKIIYEDGKAFGMSVPTLTPKMVENAIVASHAAEKLVVAHIGSQALAKDAVDFKIDGLVHLFADSKAEPELIALMKEQGVFVSPTTAVIANTCGASSARAFSKDENIAPYLNNENLSNLSKSFPGRPGATNSGEKLNHNIKALHDAGVVILAGTDAPNPGTVHGASMHHEMELLVNAGLTPSEALASATSLPAQAYKLNDRGEIKVGKRADLLLVEGDPTKDITHSRRIVSVFKNGKAIDRTARFNEVAKEKEAAETKKVASSAKLISDFEADNVESKFGAGWSTSTDQMMGGKSTGTMEIASDGAESNSSMLVKGDTQSKLPAFSGAMFSPGDGAMQASDISEYKKISFWSKCDAAADEGKSFELMMFFQKRGFQPSTKTFKATNKWQQHSFEISDFDGCDGTDVIGFWFGSTKPGEFQFKLDNVKLDP